jgi:uncharacterized damage-inducible protein DinB
LFILISMPRNQRYLASYQMHRAALQDLYALLPDDQAEFSAWEGGMSFLRLADHLSLSTARTLALAQGQAPAAPGSVSPSTSLSEARERLASSTEQMMSYVASLQDDDLSRTVAAFGGRQMPISTLVEFNIDHEAHHKGQVWMMARMVGVAPPMFVKLG